MTPGLRTHKAASLRVAIAEGLPSEMWDVTREIVSVQSTNPRKGDATTLMWSVCAEADRELKTLIIQVRPFSQGMNDDQLKKFYSKFGFEEIQADPCLMARSPELSRIASQH